VKVAAREIAGRGGQAGLAGDLKASGLDRPELLDGYFGQESVGGSHMKEKAGGDIPDSRKNHRSKC
jgi:hypothetical protein